MCTPFATFKSRASYLTKRLTSRGCRPLGGLHLGVDRSVIPNSPDFSIFKLPLPAVHRRDCVSVEEKAEVRGLGMDAKKREDFSLWYTQLVTRSEVSSIRRFLLV